MGGPENIEGGRSLVTGAPAFVATKLAVPHVRDVSVRPEALEALAAGARKRLTVVRAPAGYGKTTVVAEAAARLSWNVVWYKLDVLDHDPLALIASLVQGLRQHQPTFGEILVERFADARDDPADINQLLALLVSELAASVTDELHLVLDDYHQAASSESLNTALDFLLANLPDHVHIVLLTRCLPSIAVARLRLDDQVTEIDFEHLRFTAAQARDVLGAAGLAVSPADADRLVGLTEGWPASIALAARALAWTDMSTMERALGDPRLKNDVFSYLADEALRHESGDVVDFLARTCCLDSMTVALASAVADSDSAGAMLLHLVEHNVFTFFDEPSSTYRYHHLLRDYLCSKHVQEHGPEAFRQLQIGTAGAVESAGDPETAIELLFGANEPQLALDVVSRAGDLITDNCRLDALRSWLDRLPGFMMAHDPWGIFLKGQLLWRAGDSEGAIRELESASAAFTEDGDRRGRYVTLSALESLHFWRGDFEEAARHCRLALEQATTPDQTIHTLVSLGSASNYSGRWDDAETAWREAEFLIGPHITGEGIRIKALRGVSSRIRGHYREAVRSVTAAVDSAVAFGPRTFAVTCRGELAESLIELGEFALAKSYIEDCEAECDEYRFDHIRFQLEDTLGHLLLSIGDLRGAEAILRRLVKSDLVAQDAWSFASSLHRYARCLRLSGDIDGAASYYTHAGRIATASGIHSIALDSGASSEFCKGWKNRPQTHVVRLLAIAERSQRQGFDFTWLKSRTLSALLRHRLGDTRGCVESLRDLVPQQLALGHFRFLAQELPLHPSVTRGLLVRLADGTRAETARVLCLTDAGRHALLDGLCESRELGESVPHNLVGILTPHERAELVSAAKVRGSSRLSALLRAGGFTAASAPHSGLSDLTRRELQVLTEMARGYSNTDIAARLFVSEKTVKTHVNHIFMKLGVTNRVRAVLLLNQTEAESGRVDGNTT